MLWNAATILLCVGIMLFFRRIDRANVRIEKLKRFSDKKFNDFKDLASEENRKFRDATIEMDLLLKKSGVLAEAVRTSANDIEARLKGLDIEKENLRKVEIEIKSVTTAASDLNQQLRYIESVRSGFSDLMKKADQISGQIAKVDKESGALLQSFNEKIRERSRELSDELSIQVTKLRDQVMEKEGKITDEARSKVDALVRNFSASLVSLENSVTETGNAILDNVRMKISEVESSVDQVSARIDETDERAKDIFLSIKKTESDLSGISDKVRGIEEAIGDSRSKLITSFDEERTKIHAEMDQLSLHAISKKDEIVSAARRESEKICEKVDSMLVEVQGAERKYSQLMEKIADAEAGINNAIDSHIESVKDEFKAMDQKSVSAKSEISEMIAAQNAKVREEFSRLEERLTSIRSEIVSYEEKNRIFSRNDELVKQVDASVRQYTSILDESKERARLLDEFMKGADDFRELKRDIEKELKIYQVKKENLQNVEAEIKGLFNLADQVKNKAEMLESNASKIDQVDARIKAQTEAYISLEKRISELTEYEATIENSIQSINSIEAYVKAFEGRVKSFENTIQQSEKRANKMKDYLAKIEENTITLRARESDIMQVMDRFQELDTLQEHMEKRIDQISAMMKRVESIRMEVEQTDSRLQSISNEADRKIKQFSDIVQSVPSDSPTPSITKQMKGSPVLSKGINDNTVKMIRDLANKGWEPDDIARKMMIEENTVRLIVNT